MDETDDIKATRAHNRVNELFAAGQTHTSEYAHAVDEFIRHAPAECRAEMLTVAIERGYCPSPAAMISGAPFWNVLDIAAFYELSLMEADKRLAEKGAKLYLLADRGVL